MQTSNLLLAIVGIVALAAALAVSLPRPSPTTDPELAAAHARRDRSLTEIADSLQRIERLLARESLPTAPLATEAVRVETEGVSDLRAAVDSLREVMEGARPAGRALGPSESSEWRPRTTPSPLLRLHESKPGPDWAAWDDFADVYEKDPRSGEIQLMLCSAADILQRFGTPTRLMRSQSGGVFWSYQDPPEGKLARFSAQLEFSTTGQILSTWLNRRARRDD